MTILDSSNRLSLSQRANLLAIRQVNTHVDTQDINLRAPLTAMMRRLNENVLGIRAKRHAGLPVGPIHEVILEVEAEKDRRLDDSAQRMLGKIATKEPVQVAFGEQDLAGTISSYVLPMELGGLIVDRVSLSYEETVCYTLHNISPADITEDDE